jgi:NAD-dependent SIR2 family protein deacetylase
MSAGLDELLAALAGRRLAVITGAGCSTASGIGDYRDAEGAWKRNPPIQMQDFLAHESARRRYWARSMRGWPMMARAEPNDAHRALAAVERVGLVEGLISQNVDGLHQRAGQRGVLELHGSLAEVVCLDCGHRTTRRELQTRLEDGNAFVLDAPAAAAPDGDADLTETLDLSGFQVPECTVCGGVLKPDVVFYGDSVPKARVQAAYAMVESADALLVVGSSLMVFSSFRFCRFARERGTPIVAVNQGRTRADEWLAVKVQADCAAVLPNLAAGLTDAARLSGAAGA